MASQRVVPRGEWLEVVDQRGEPRRALFVSMGIGGLCLLSGSLDQIAQIVTAFFILTYLAINLVVVLEQRLAMVSFRPTLKVHQWVPLAGLASCSLGLFISSPTMGLFGGTLVVLVYIWLQRQQLHTPWDTVRSGIHVRVAAWAAQRAGMVATPERAWSPEMLIPTDDLDESEVLFDLARQISRRTGGIRIVGMRADADLEMELMERAEAFRLAGCATTATVIDGGGFAQGCCIVIDAMRGMFMGPNLVLLNGAQQDEKVLQIVVDHCHARGVGMGVFLPHPDGALGRAQQITVWLSERSPDWALNMHNANLDLPVLIGYLLGSQAGSSLRLSTVIRTIEDRSSAMAFLVRLSEQGRLPKNTDVHVGEGPFLDAASDSPYSDIHIFGLPTTIDRRRLTAIRDACGGACLFLLDSGQESILA
jgi:hypothetical protein